MDAVEPAGAGQAGAGPGPAGAEQADAAPADAGLADAGPDVADAGAVVGLAVVASNDFEFEACFGAS